MNPPHYEGAHRCTGPVYTPTIGGCRRALNQAFVHEQHFQLRQKEEEEEAVLCNH